MYLSLLRLVGRYYFEGRWPLTTFGLSLMEPFFFFEVPCGEINTILTHTIEMHLKFTDLLN